MELFSGPHYFESEPISFCSYLLFHQIVSSSTNGKLAVILVNKSSTPYLADERDAPAYVIFSDVALRQMAQEYPSNEQEFLRISGVGTRKLEEFGAAFLAAIAEYVESNPRQSFLNTSTGPSPSVRTPGKPKPLSSTIKETLRLFQRGFSVEDISTQRGLVVGTIYGHLEQAIQAGETIDINRLVTLEQQAQIAAAFAKTGLGNLTGAKELLGDLYNYGQLRLFRAVELQKTINEEL